MPISDTDMVRAWTHVLTLSNLKPQEAVTILTSQTTNRQTLATAKIAAGLMGARVNQLDLTPVNGALSLSRDSLAYLGTTPLTGNKPALAALKASDLVLDLMTLLFSPEQAEVLESGARILLAVEPPEVLVRMLPRLEDKTTTEKVAARLSRAREMRVTSPAGTDLVCPLGQYPAMQEYGFVDTPGRWDHWPSGFALTWPNELGTSGRVVFDKGDILLPQKNYVTDPIELTVSDGYVTAIEGGVDAALLRDYMESFHDPEAYAVSHIGWGTQKRARWSTLGLYDREQTIAMDARAYAGNFLFSLGPNNEIGGNRVTACHIDVPMHGCTVSLDGEVTVQDGRLVDEAAVQ